MLQLELPHINVLSKVDLLSHYGDLGVLLSVVSSTGTQSSHNFNLDFYTEVQDLSYLENTLNTVSPRFTELNMAFISVIEDFGLVGFETLAVEVRTTYPSATRS